MGSQLSSYWMYANLLLRGDLPRNSCTPFNSLSFFGNGCEGYSPNIYIPPKTDLTSELDTSIGYKFFHGFKVMHSNMACYGIWYEPKLEILT